MSKKQKYNYARLLKFIEGVKHFNPWIAQCILNFINENDSVKIDLEYVSPFSPVGIFANLIGLFSAVYLYVNKASVLETFNIFKDMFVKSAKSKSPLELAVWFVVLVLIILLPTRRSA